MMSLVTEWKQLLEMCAQGSRITANREEERYSMCSNLIQWEAVEMALLQRLVCGVLYKNL